METAPCFFLFERLNLILCIFIFIPKVTKYMSSQDKCGEISQFVTSLNDVLSLANTSIHRDEIITEDFIKYLEGIVMQDYWLIA